MRFGEMHLRRAFRWGRIRVRKGWKRLRHPRVFGTPLISDLSLIFATVRYSARFSRGNFEDFHKAPLVVRKRFWGRVSPADTKWHLSELPSRVDVLEECATINKRLGVWPISLSYPRGFNGSTKLHDWESRSLKSDIIPGAAYGYRSEVQYLANYEGAKHALTHKKAGWDCFRHLEILASGALPVLPDARFIPKETMVHYPKKALEELSSKLPTIQPELSTESQRKLYSFVSQNLSSAAMAQYILEAAQVGNADRIFFFDEALVKKPDYLSVMTLIGLKQILEHKLRVFFEVPYIYEDFESSSKSFWGLGFGYSRVLPTRYRSVPVAISHNSGGALVKPAPTDWLIVGNVTRNWVAANDMLSHFAPERTVWMHGDDRAPTASERREFRRRVSTVFIRELNGHL